MKLKTVWGKFLDLFEEDRPGEPVYDPVHVAGLLVGCLAALGALYWLLWGLLVCEGGLFTKVVPFLRVLFTSKTLGDYGYEGHPHQLGIFEGWIVNVAALVLTAAAAAGVWSLFQPKKQKRKTP